MCLKVPGGGASRPQGGRRRSLWTYGWQEEELLHLKTVERGACLSQGGRKKS